MSVLGKTWIFWYDGRRNFEARASIVRRDFQCGGNARDPMMTGFHNHLETPLGVVLLGGTNAHARGWKNKPMRILGNYAAVLVLEGNAEFHRPDAALLPLSPGDLLLIFPELPHRYGPPPGRTWSETYLVFNGPVFDLWRKQGVLDPARPVLRLGQVDYWQKQFQRIAEIPAWLGMEQSLLQVCRLQEMLGEALASRRQSRLGAAQWAWLQHARRLLDDAPPAVDWDSLAAQLEMSYEGFRRKFTRLAGTSPGRYHAGAVMRRACDLIQRQRLGNKQTAAACGFCDEFHFSRRFRQIIGLSPSEFRHRLP
jgi:AraC-like DNA-binding protein